MLSEVSFLFEARICASGFWIRICAKPWCGPRPVFTAGVRQESNATLCSMEALAQGIARVAFMGTIRDRFRGIPVGVNMGF
jgi:hypothetical protein